MNILLDELRVHNGLTWGSLRLPLADQGLCLVTGHNGSGKTNITELILDILYGKTTKSGRAQRIVNRVALRNKQGMTLEIIFRREETAGEYTKYRVCKSYGIKGKKNGVVVYRGDEPQPVSPTRSVEAQTYVSNLIGINFEEFCSSVCLPHRATHPLVSGTPGSRAKYISDAYGLGIYDEIQIKIKALRERIQARLTGIEDTSSRLKLLESELAQEDSLNHIRSAVSALQQRVENLKEKYAQTEVKLISAVRRRDKQRRRKKLEREISRLQDGDGHVTRERIRKLRRERDTLRGKIPDLRRRNVLEKMLLQSTMIGIPGYAIPENVEKRKSALKALRVQLSKLDAQIEIIESLNGLDRCPTCRQKLRGDINPSRLGSLQQGRNKMKAELTPLQREQKLFEEYILQLKEEQRLQKELDQLPVGNLAKIQTTLAQTDKEISDIETHLEGILRREALVVEISDLPKGHPDKTQRMVDRVTRERNDIRSKWDRESRRLLAVQQKISRIQKLCAQIRTTRKEVAKGVENRKKLTMLSDCVDAFGNRGLRLERMQQILAEIQTRLTPYIQNLLPKYNFTLAPGEAEIIFEASDRKDPKCVCFEIGSLSEGEKKRLSLALLLAERELRATQLNVFFLDEFDGGLDDSGRDTLIDILSELRIEFPSIFAISHSEGIRGHGAFSQHIHVYRDSAGISHMKCRRR